LPGVQRLAGCPRQAIRVREWAIRAVFSLDVSWKGRRGRVDSSRSPRGLNSRNELQELLSSALAKPSSGAVDALIPMSGRIERAASADERHRV
jgi:hypothetical protein